MPLRYDKAMFDFGPAELRVPLPDDAGFSGLRIHAPVNEPNVFEEFLVFQGASYFRGKAKGQTYGLSARGLAVNTAQPEGEEFPAVHRLLGANAASRRPVRHHLCASGQHQRHRRVPVHGRQGRRYRDGSGMRDLSAPRPHPCRHRAIQQHVLFRPGRSHIPRRFPPPGARFRRAAHPDQRGRVDLAAVGHGEAYPLFDVLRRSAERLRSHAAAAGFRALSGHQCRLRKAAQRLGAAAVQLGAGKRRSHRTADGF